MEKERLTLALVAENPERATQTLTLADGETIHYRPLLPSDLDLLTEFLESLLPMTLRYYGLDDTPARSVAQAHCEAINRYDKFRMVALSTRTSAEQIIALFEFSLDLTGEDCTRYDSYGIFLFRTKTCRFGPCIRDEYQNRGLGTALMPYTLEIARRFGNSRVILWGGVLQENVRAVHFYRKHGFRLVGAFQEDKGRDSYDMILDL